MVTIQNKYERVIDFIRSYTDTTSAKGYVIGISSGKDSTVVAKLLVDAVGKDKVFGVLMPNGPQKDIEDSITVCDYLGINFVTVNIRQTYAELIGAIDRNDMFVSTKAIINIPPRLRMTVLYTIAQSKGYRVAGTGNASEAFIGWCTKWGDMACDINPIAHLTCTEVIELGDYMGLPHDLVHKTPADGLTGKSDEENFGFTYKELDDLIEKQRNFEKTGSLTSPHTETELKILKLHASAYHKDYVIKLCK